MPDAVSAYITAPAALLLMVPLTFGLFVAYPAFRAAFLSLLIAELLLPVGYGWELPGVTSLDKATIPLLSATAACVFMAPRELRHLRIQGGTLILLLALFVGPFLTAFTNTDSYPVADVVLPPLTTWDGVGILRMWGFIMILPFLLGRMLVRNVAQLEFLLRALVVAMLAYSIPMLWEVRMSPQLHSTVYGYFPHSFFQQMRAGGYRPVVFMGHGLPLAILTSFSVVASLVLWRRGRRIRGLPSPVVTGYLGALLVLCKTLSALTYAAVGGALVFFASAKLQVRAAIAIALIVLTYPMLRSFDLFPTNYLTKLSDSIDPDRGESLQFRFDNEDLLLGHARERWMFGWGGYGRDRIFSTRNAEEGEKSVTDGLWIILLGQTGAMGFLGTFGLMLLPIFQTPGALRRMKSAADQRVLTSFALLLALNWADSLPNALSGGIVMVFATGAFSGVVAAQRVHRPIREQRKQGVSPPVAAHSGMPEPLR